MTKAKSCTGTKTEGAIMSYERPSCTCRALSDLSDFRTTVADATCKNDLRKMSIFFCRV